VGQRRGGEQSQQERMGMRKGGNTVESAYESQIKMGKEADVLKCKKLGMFSVRNMK